MEKIILGSEVTDLVTNFKGIATARCKYLNGCVQIQVHPTVDEKGDIRKAFWIDESQLIATGRGVIDSVTPSEPAGGGFREHPNE